MTAASARSIPLPARQPRFNYPSSNLKARNPGSNVSFPIWTPFSSNLLSSKFTKSQHVSELAPGGRGQGVTIKGGLLLMIGLLLVQMVVLSQWWGVLLPFWGRSLSTRALSLSQLQLQQVNRKSLSELGGVSGAVVCSAIVVLQ